MSVPISTVTNLQAMNHFCSTLRGLALGSTFCARELLPTDEMLDTVLQENKFAKLESLTVAGSYTVQVMARLLQAIGSNIHELAIF